VPDDLLWIIKAWPQLENKIREAVVALVRTGLKGPPTTLVTNHHHLIRPPGADSDSVEQIKVLS